MHGPEVFRKWGEQLCTLTAPDNRLPFRQLHPNENRLLESLSCVEFWSYSTI